MPDLIVGLRSVGLIDESSQPVAIAYLKRQALSTVRVYVSAEELAATLGKEANERFQEAVKVITEVVDAKLAHDLGLNDVDEDAAG